MNINPLNHICSLRKVHNYTQSSSTTTSFNPKAPAFVCQTSAAGQPMSPSNTWSPGFREFNCQLTCFFGFQNSPIYCTQLCGCDRWMHTERDTVCENMWDVIQVYNICESIMTLSLSRCIYQQLCVYSEHACLQKFSPFHGHRLRDLATNKSCKGSASDWVQHSHSQKGSKKSIQSVWRVDDYTIDIIFS